MPPARFNLNSAQASWKWKKSNKHSRAESAEAAEKSKTVEAGEILVNKISNIFG
jgi:hypothetical protein